jgi:hypothetical protein
MSASATPTPWHYTKSQPGVFYIDEEAFHSYGFVAIVYAGGRDEEGAEADARLIVAAVNNHVPLLAALRDLLDTAYTDGPFRAALARATKVLADAEGAGHE